VRRRSIKTCLCLQRLYHMLYSGPGCANQSSEKNAVHVLPTRPCSSDEIFLTFFLQTRVLKAHDANPAPKKRLAGVLALCTKCFCSSWHEVQGLVSPQRAGNTMYRRGNATPNTAVDR